MFYDHRVKLIMSAEVPPDHLYTEGQVVDEFARTVSRLMEMQSRDYIESPRRIINAHLT
jgi:cell division protein ZapE